MYTVGSYVGIAFGTAGDVAYYGNRADNAIDGHIGDLIQARIATDVGYCRVRCARDGRTAAAAAASASSAAASASATAKAAKDAEDGRSRAGIDIDVNLMGALDQDSIGTALVVIE